MPQLVSALESFGVDASNDDVRWFVDHFIEVPGTWDITYPLVITLQLLLQLLP